MPKCDFKKIVCNYIEIALRHRCSPANLLHIFGTPLPKNTSGWLLLKIGVSSSNKSNIQLYTKKYQIIIEILGQDN